MTLLILSLIAVLIATNIVGAVAYTHAQVWRERAEQYQSRVERLRELLGESEAAYQALQHSLQTGGWVRLPNSAEIEVGKWN